MGVGFGALLFRSQTMEHEHRQAIRMRTPMMGGCIAIVDDDPAYVSACEEAFGQEGRRTICFTDGGEAWRDIRSRPNLLLVVANWMLPGLDGHRVCRLLARHRPAVTTVLMVGRSFLPETWAKMRLRADYVLAKPFSAIGIKEQARLLIAAAYRRAVASLGDLPDRASRDDSDSAVNSFCRGSSLFPAGSRLQDKQKNI